MTELARAFPVSLQAVSKHVQVLEAAGVVRRRADGRTRWIALQPGALERARTWLEAPAGFWADRLSALEAELERSGDRQGNAPDEASQGERSA